MQRHRCLLMIFGLVSVGYSGDAERVYYRIDTGAGSAAVADGTPAASAQLGAVQGIAVDRSGNLYLADTDRHTVRKVLPGGTIVTVAGTGAPGFSGDGGPAKSAQLNLPYGLAVDAAGYLYIADLGNQRVRRVAPDGGITTFAGGGKASLPGDGGAATDASLLSPRNVAADAAGNLYIAEFDGHRIRKVGADGKISTIAGTGTAGFRGDGGPAAAAQLGYPAGVAVDRGGVVYVADTGNLRVRKILPDGTISSLPGVVPGTAGAMPVAVAANAAGDLYVADSGNVVRCYTAGGLWTVAAGTGGSGFSGDGGTAAFALLAAPRDVAVDALGNLYIADGVRLRRVDGRGIIVTLAGDGYLHAGDGGPATAASLAQPAAVSLDGAGNLYIADAGTARVRQVAAGTMGTLAGNGIAAAGEDNLNQPMGVAADPSGRVFVADTNNHRVRQFGPAGTTPRTVAGTGNPGTGMELLPATQTSLRGPRGVCLDRAGSLYIVDTGNHRVLKLVGTLLQTAAGTGVGGDAGDGGAARQALLNQPEACAADSWGNLYIADTGNHRIRKVTAAGAIVAVAGAGAVGYAGDEDQALTARFDSPRGLAADDAGNVYIADTGNHRIRQVTPDGKIHTIAGLGSAGFGGDGGAAEAAQLNAPAGLFLDGAGAVYVADSGNNRVRRISPDHMGPVIAPPPVVTPPPPVITMPAPVTTVHGATQRPGPIAPGEIVLVNGQGLGPETAAAGHNDASGLLATDAGGVEVRFDGIPAPIFSAQSLQVAVQAPYTLVGKDKTHIDVFYQGKPAGSVDVAVAGTNPGLFPAMVHADGTLNSQRAPAPKGTVVALFATGEGLTNGRNTAGMPAQAPYAGPMAAVSVTIAGIACDILYAGSAPGQIGVLQVNVRIPPGFVAGPVPLALTVGSVTGPPLTLWVKDALVF